MAARKPAKKNSLSTVQCVWGLVCSLSSIDQQRNNISLFNVLDQLNIPKEEFEKRGDEGVLIIPMQHEIVLVWRRVINPALYADKDRMMFDIRIKVVDPRGEQTQEILFPLVFEPGKRVMRTRVQNQSFHLSVPGEYSYVVTIEATTTKERKKACEIPLFVSELES